MSAGVSPVRLLFFGASVLALDLTLLYFGLKINFLDGRLFYLPSEVFLTLERQGAEGRQFYETIAMCDLGFILAYTAFVVSLFRSLGGLSMRHLAIPLLMGFSDTVETAGILFCLSEYPAQPLAVAQVVALATVTKWALAAGTLVTLAHLIVQWRRGAKTRPN